MGRRFKDILEVQERLDVNLGFISEIENFIQEEDDISDKLEIIHLVGMLYSEFVTGIYASELLEKQIRECGNEIKYCPQKLIQKNKVLIVMSLAGYVGGHSVLVHNWICYDCEREYSIVFTEQEYENIPKFLVEDVKMSGGTIITLNGNYMQKAEKLLNESQIFERIILFTHMDDMVPVLAYGNVNWNIPIYFYNHADFRFSFGYSVSDVILNLYEYDMIKTTQVRGCERDKSILLPFPGNGVFARECEIKNIKDDAVFELIDGKKIIVSMGANWKYNTVIDYEFDIFVYELIKDTEYVFYIIGADPGNEKWKRLNEQTCGRAIALGELPREKAEKIISKADLYIVSFPMLAEGARWADAYSVPWLALNLIGRVENAEDVRYAKSMEELLEKSRMILEGNSEQYVQNVHQYAWTTTRWKERWEEVYKEYNRHSINRIEPIRECGIREYINCQLLQENAEKRVYQILTKVQLQERILKKIDVLIRKYRMETLDLYERLCEERVMRKHNQYRLEVFSKIILMHHKKINIKDYFIEMGYNIVAIYGMSDVGNCLFNELLSQKAVDFLIDKRAEKLNYDIPIYSPTQIFTLPDLVINATKWDNKQLIDENGYYGIRIIKVNDLLDNILSWK